MSLLPAAGILTAGLVAAADHGAALDGERVRAVAPAPCDGSGAGGVAVWTSPEVPAAGIPLRAIAVSENPLPPGATLVHVAPSGKRAPLAAALRGGPPWSLSGQVAAPEAGHHRFEVALEGKASLACARATVVPRGRRRAARAATAHVWPTTRAWNRATENLYSAWIEALFDAPPEADFSFPSLAPIVRDPARNFLHDHLGFGEDAARGRTALPAEPDCADLPFYLRAVFAWKLGLPFGFRDCDRGTSNRPPRCGAVVSNAKAAEAPDPAGAFRKFLRLLANTVHSGSARTALGDEQADTYPVPLERRWLRPGVIYADPYGHVLLVVKWVDQGKAGAGGGGRLCAVDGQPDNSIARKRFWEGTFLFASDVPSAGPGFKALRPMVAPRLAAVAARVPRGRRESAVAAAGVEAIQLGNEALRGATPFAPLDDAQARLGAEAFHATMARLLNPAGLDAARAYEETLAALAEQLRTRVGSVENAEKYVRGGGAVAAMPEGAKIFETAGPWEDYSTPSRDMRLIIAMNVLAGLPERIARHPDLFVLGGRKPEDVSAEVERLHRRRAAEESFEYLRSDGSPFRLTVADALGRKAAFEMGYNPNDCPEVRWGAAEGASEIATCRRRAPAEQRARMESVRGWFRDARRPSR